MIGIGLDLCEIARMDRLLQQGETFLQRYFTPLEQEYIKSKGGNAPQSMAAIFAAKEALLKALGRGLGQGLSLKDIEIGHEENGRPYYHLSPKAQSALTALGGSRAFLTLTHEAGMAAAMAVVE